MTRTALLALALIAVACNGPADAPAAPAQIPSGATAFLTEIARLEGLRADWPDGTGIAPEIMGPGVALADLDADGRLDVVQLTMPDPGVAEGPLGRVWLQDKQGGFSNPVELPASGFAQGVTVGDVNADGLPDLFLANWGPDRLLLNRGDGRFEPVAGEQPWDAPFWSVSAAFCDFDGDDDLDLYVAHYLDYDPAKACFAPNGAVAYCSPQVFPGEIDHLYVNDGRGGFDEVSAAAGMLLPGQGGRAKGLGVACADLTGDGKLDFYVANDRESNQLWTNLGDGTFADEAVLRGAAVNRHGRPEASMGIAVGDIDGDASFDVLLTHLEGENNTVYGGGMAAFRDVTPRAGLATHDFGLTGFGCALIDLELDGDLDFLVVNGKVRRRATQEDDGFWSRYAEPNQVYENHGDGTFANASEREAPFAAPIEVTRGLAYGDLDNDGDADLVVANADNTVRVYRNDSPRGTHHWVGILARTRGGPALGARVTLHAAERTWESVVPAGSSYASASDPRLGFGLGSVDRVDRVEVSWPDGSKETFPPVEVDRESILVQGEGRPL